MEVGRRGDGDGLLKPWSGVKGRSHRLRLGVEHRAVESDRVLGGSQVLRCALRTVVVRDQKASIEDRGVRSSQSVHAECREAVRVRYELLLESIARAAEAAAARE